MATVLLTNGQQRKTLSAARSLGRRGLRVCVADTTRVHPAGWSRYTARSLVCPDPKREPDAYVDWLERTAAEERIDALFPMDDDSLELALARRERLEAVCAVPLPPLSSYRIAADKGQAVRHAMHAGADCPRTTLPASLEEAERLAPLLAYPVVVKPRRSSGSRGIRVAETPGELIARYRDVHAVYPLPLIQEYIAPGDRYDVCLLYGSDGRLLASFVQKELRHYPIERGPSTMQESVRRPDVLDAALAVMDGLPWRGVVELEFMIDPADGRPKFMEINPRFWNSLETAVQAGVDFPWLLYGSAVGADVPAVHEYAVGVRCRNLLPGDALHFLANRRRFDMSPPIWAGRRSGVIDDIWSADDPLPTLGALAAFARYAAQPEMRRLLKQDR